MPPDGSSCAQCPSRTYWKIHGAWGTHANNGVLTNVECAALCGANPKCAMWLIDASTLPLCWTFERPLTNAVDRSCVPAEAGNWYGEVKLDVAAHLAITSKGPCARSSPPPPAPPRDLEQPEQPTGSGQPKASKHPKQPVPPNPPEPAKPSEHPNSPDKAKHPGQEHPKDQPEQPNAPRQPNQPEPSDQSGRAKPKPPNRPEHPPKHEPLAQPEHPERERPIQPKSPKHDQPTQPDRSIQPGHQTSPPEQSEPPKRPMPPSEPAMEPTGSGEADEDLYARTFPMDVRPQAHDIIRTWLFSTVVRAHFDADNIPWKNCALSGWILDPDRKKLLSEMELP